MFILTTEDKKCSSVFVKFKTLNAFNEFDVTLSDYVSDDLEIFDQDTDSLTMSFNLTTDKVFPYNIYSSLLSNTNVVELDIEGYNEFEDPKTQRKLKILLENNND